MYIYIYVYTILYYTILYYTPTGGPRRDDFGSLRVLSRQAGGLIITAISIVINVIIIISSSSSSNIVIIIIIISGRATEGCGAGLFCAGRGSGSSSSSSSRNSRNSRNIVILSYSIA